MKLSPTSHGIVAMWTVNYETESNQSWYSSNADSEI